MTTPPTVMSDPMTDSTADRVWTAIMSDPMLARARSKLSVDEIRTIVKHCLASDPSGVCDCGRSLAHRTEWGCDLCGWPKGKPSIAPEPTPYMGTAKQNTGDMLDRGRARGGAKRIRFGSETSCAKLTEEQVRQIIVLFPMQSNIELASKFSVNRRTIADIRNRKTWPKVWEDAA